MKISIIGSTGQLGQDLTKELQTKHEIVALTHQKIEVENLTSVKTLRKHEPDIIINTAAFHRTDQCELEPLTAYSVNSIGPKNISQIAKEIGAVAVFISTNYVFPGTKKEPYTEQDSPYPINTYGISKLAGELYTRQNPKHYIFRVASLFGTAGASGRGENFIEAMIRKAKNNETINVFKNITMSPTYTKDAAKTINQILTQKLPYDTYHTTNQGSCSWYEFAKEILDQTQLTPKLKPVKYTKFKTKAKRPLNSALTSTKLNKYNILTREWKLALTAYLKEKNHIS